MSQLRRGHLSVIAGPMGSGKSIRMIEAISLAKIRKLRVCAVKPTLDTRDGSTIKTRLAIEPIPAIGISTPEDLLLATQEADFVAIDEAQFLDASILPAIQDLLKRGVEIVAGGLDTDFLGRPYGIMPQLLAMADDVTKMKAVCTLCSKKLATRTNFTFHPQGEDESLELFAYRRQKLEDFLSGKSHELVGDMGAYEPRCPEHHFSPSF